MAVIHRSVFTTGTIAAGRTSDKSNWVKLHIPGIPDSEILCLGGMAVVQGSVFTAVATRFIATESD